IRGAVRERQALQIDGRQPDAVIENYPDQLGERVGPVAGAADGAAVGRHQMTEWVALPLPILQYPVERVLLEQHANAHILLVSASALEEPGIGILPDVLAGFDDLGP